MITVEQAGYVRKIGIVRPEKKNALTVGMYSDLAQAISSAETDPRTRVLMLHGSEECFTAGNDLADFAEDPPSGPTSPVYRFLRELASAEKPIVAAVAGHAVGIGTTALLHCDIVVAAENAVFILPFTDLGLCPEAGSTVLLPATIGVRNASEMLLAGTPVKAQRAYEMGLVNHVVQSGTALGSAFELASRLSTKPPDAVRISKRLLKEPMKAKVEAAMDLETAEFVRRLQSPEAKEAFAAFREKRPPSFPTADNN